MHSNWARKGALASKWFGGTISDSGNIEFQAAKIIGALLIYLFLPDAVAGYLLLGLIGGTGFIVGKNIWTLLRN